MTQKTVSADYLRHNLKEIVEEVLSGKSVTLKYGYLGEILLLPKNPVQPTKKDLLLKEISQNYGSNQIKKKINKKKKYKNNREMYDDLYKGLID